MGIAATTDHAVPARARHAEHPDPIHRLPVRILTSVLRRLRERRVERAVWELGHPGVLDDFLRASRRG